jgi:hypothetical protein
MVGGCSLDRQTAPTLAGPSELGLSLAITATPDIVPQDGTAKSVIEVTARDANGNPMSGLSLRAEVTPVGGFPGPLGATVSTLMLLTGSNGRVSVTYVPPAPTASDVIVTITFRPVGTNYTNSVVRSVTLRLAKP